LARGGIYKDSTKVIQDPNVNMAANLSPPYPAYKQAIYNTFHDKETSKLHSPQHCTFKCNTNKLYKYIPNQNHQPSTEKTD